MPDTPRYLAYVDGSSLSNPGGPGGTGFVVLDRARPALRFGGTPLHAGRDVRGHEQPDGAARGARGARGAAARGEPVDVVSDSRYVVDALSKWIHGWRRKGWKTATGEPVLNRDLIEALDARGRELKVRYRWVRGHDGHAVNEIVDALAQSAARGTAGPQEAEVLEALRAVKAIRAAGDAA